MPSSSPNRLLTVRAALLLLIAAIVGLVAGAVGYFAYRDLAIAVLVGGGAAGGALGLLHGLLAADERE